MPETKTYWQDLEEPTKLAEAIIATVDKIKTDQQYIDDDLRRFTELYLDRDVTSFKPGEYLPQAPIDEVDEEVADGSLARRIIAWNMVKGIIDAATAKITIRDPDPWVQTEDGKIEDAKQGRNIRQILIAIGQSRNTRRNNRRTVKAAALYPFGATKTYARVQRGQQPQVFHDYVHPARLHWDNQACLDTGEPLNYYHEIYLPRRYLLKRYDGAKEAVKKALREAEDASTSGHDLVRVIDAYELAVGDVDGRRVLAFDGGVLEERPWEYERGPFSLMRWEDDVLGALGLSVANDLEGIQEELRNTLRMIKRNKNQYGDPAVYNDRSNKLRRAEMDNNFPFKVWEGDGPNPPTILAQPFIAHQMLEWVAMVRESAMEQSGMAKMNVTGERPQNLRSGKAVLTYYDITTERFASVVKNYLQMAAVDQPWQAIRVLRELGKSHNVKVPAADGRVFYLINWGKVELQDEQFKVTIKPGSSLPNDPAGREERVGLRMQEGIIDRGEARQLLGWSDLEKFDRLANAQREYLMDIFEEMLEGGEYVPPDDRLDLGGLDPQTGEVVPGLAQDLCTKYIWRARCDNVPEEQVRLLERWLDEANELVREATMLAAGPPPVPETLPAGPAAAEQLAGAAAALNPPGAGAPGAGGMP
jgi:hypothetical protein